MLDLGFAPGRLRLIFRSFPVTEKFFLQNCFKQGRYLFAARPQNDGYAWTLGDICKILLIVLLLKKGYIMKNFRVAVGYVQVFDFQHKLFCSP